MRKIGCLGWVAIAACGTTGTTSPGPTPGQKPVSIASSPTDRRLAELEPADLLPGGAEPLDRAIASYFDRVATARAYIQTDKPLYQPGETIWFRADLRATRTMVGGPPVGLTVQLTSPRGSIVSTKRVLAQGGIARNDLRLADEIEGGEYAIGLVGDDGTTATRKIVVNTYETPRLQKSLELLRKAYGEGDQVSAAIEIKRATGEPFADRPLVGVVTIDDVETARLSIVTDKVGAAVARFQLPPRIARGDGLLTILVEDGGVTEAIQKRIPILLKTLQLSVFPEGGDLVDGIPGRVYFMARTMIGKPADVEGRAVDDRGDVVATFSSIHDGMGRFELTPAADRRYRLEIVRPVGIVTVAEIPAARPGGCVIRSVDQRTPNALRIAAICSTSRRLIAQAVVRERRLASGAFDVEAGLPTVVELPADPTRQGVARVTLFSSAREPLAERLVYHGRGADLKITVSADRTSYSPRDRVKLAIRAEDAAGKPVAASVAVAVVDETVLSFADDKTGRILARMFLEPELGAAGAEAIEEPNFYFSDQPEAAAAMDALLATRGYRRFEWRPVFADSEGGQP